MIPYFFEDSVTFIGGPWDLHRVRLSDGDRFPTYEVPTYEVPMLDSHGISVHVAGVKEELVPMKRAVYRRFELPDPSHQQRYTVIYVFERERS